MTRWFLIWFLTGSLCGMTRAWWEEADRADMAEARALAAESRAERAERWANAVENEAEMMMEGMGK